MTLRTLTEISAKGDILVFDGPVRLDLARPQLLLLATFCRAGDSKATSVMHGAWAPGGRPGSGQGFAPRRVPPAHTARAYHPAWHTCPGPGPVAVMSEFKGGTRSTDGPVRQPDGGALSPRRTLVRTVDTSTQASSQHPCRVRCPCFRSAPASRALRFARTSTVQRRWRAHATWATRVCSSGARSCTRGRRDPATVPSW